MTTHGTTLFFVATGTIAAIDTFNDAVNAKLAEGYYMITGPLVEGANISQTMAKGSATSLVAYWTITVAPTVGVGGSGAFTIAGDVTADFRPGFRFTVVGSTGNDGVYTVLGDALFDTTNTVITVKEDVPDATVDGIIYQYAP